MTAASVGIQDSIIRPWGGGKVQCTLSMCIYPQLTSKESPHSSSDEWKINNLTHHCGHVRPFAIYAVIVYQVAITV